MRLATARMFAQSGASVVLADLDGDLAAKSAFLIVFCDPLTDRAQFGLGIN